MTTTPAFLPENLRPVPKKQGHHRRRKPLLFILGLLGLSLIGSGIFFWRIDEIRIESCPGLPPCALENLESFRGAWVPTLDLDILRREIDHWPGVRRCEISLKLPGELVIRAEAAPIAASIHTALSWHALSPHGEIGRRIEEPISPVLEDFPLEDTELRRALSAGERLAQGLQGELQSLRWISPEDLEVKLELSGENRVIRLRVNPSGGPGEQWCFAHLRNQKNAIWADLRRADRIVVREHS